MRRLLPIAWLAVLAVASTAEAAFPSHTEIMDVLDALDAEARITVLRVGTSEEGRAIRAAVVADPPVARPEDVGGRVVTLLYTQQHGNEPAGTPAAIALLEQLAGALGDEVLTDQVVLVVPMVNPDGAEAGTRGNSDGTDTNRDHMNLTTETARLVHRLVHAWSPAVAIDHHEYGGTGLGTGPVYTYDWDATILWPRHANVDFEVVEASKDVNEAMRERLREEGYSAGDYGTLTANGIPLSQLAGGPTPDIARNHYGLHHAASLLVESRVDDEDPVRGDGADRRTEVHLLTMEATVRYAAAHAAELIAVRDGAAERALGREIAYDDGSTAEFPAWGWRVSDAPARAVLEGHGVAVDGDLVAAAQPLRHHGALLVDPSSAWSLTDAERLDAGPLAGAVEERAALPAAGVLAAAGVLGAAFLRRRA